jgi:hypothetical protein
MLTKYTSCHKNVLVTNDTQKIKIKAKEHNNRPKLKHMHQKPGEIESK